LRLQLMSMYIVLKQTDERLFRESVDFHYLYINLLTDRNLLQCQKIIHSGFYSLLTMYLKVGLPLHITPVPKPILGIEATPLYLQNINSQFTVVPGNFQAIKSSLASNSSTSAAYLNPDLPLPNHLSIMSTVHT